MGLDFELRGGGGWKFKININCARELPLYTTDPSGVSNGKSFQFHLNPVLPSENSICFATKTELMYRQQFSCLRNSRRTSGRYYRCKESEHSTLFTLVLINTPEKGVYFFIITKTELVCTHKTVLCVCVQPLKSLGDCFQASVMEREQCPSVKTRVRGICGPWQVWSPKC